MTQKALIIETDSDLRELNELLEEGWMVVSQYPMGGAGYGYAGGDTYSNGYGIVHKSLVILNSPLAL